MVVWKSKKFEEFQGLTLKAEKKKIYFIRIKYCLYFKNMYRFSMEHN